MKKASTNRQENQGQNLRAKQRVSRQGVRDQAKETIHGQ